MKDVEERLNKLGSEMQAAQNELKAELQKQETAPEGARLTA